MFPRHLGALRSRRGVTLPRVARLRRLKSDRNPQSKQPPNLTIQLARRQKLADWAEWLTRCFSGMDRRTQGAALAKRSVMVLEAAVSIELKDRIPYRRFERVDAPGLGHIPLRPETRSDRTETPPKPGSVFKTSRVLAEAVKGRSALGQLTTAFGLHRARNAQLRRSVCALSFCVVYSPI